MNLRKIFFIKKDNHKIVISFFNIKIAIKNKYSRIDVLKKLLFMLPSKFKLLCLSFLDSEYRWKYEIQYKKFTYDEIFELFKTQKIYPKNILSVSETIDYLINTKCSLARMGDGEEFLCNMLAETCAYPELKQRLLEICAEGSNDSCLVCINNFNADNELCPKEYRQHFVHYYSMVVPAQRLQKIKFSETNIYGDAYALAFYLHTDDKEIFYERRHKIETLWQNRKVLFVVNNFSDVLKDDVVFKDVLEKGYIYVPSSNAYEKYDEVMREITENYDASWLIYVEAGAMATVLCYELSKQGYQALDMGSYYNRAYVQLPKKFFPNAD